MTLRWRGCARLPIRLAAAVALTRLVACAPAPEVRAVAAPAPSPASLPMPDYVSARSPGAPRSCRLEVAAAMTLLTDPAGKPVVRVMAGGKVLLVWVDSGAETSVLTQNGADRLGVSVGAGSRSIVGFGGQQGYGVATLPPMAIGGQVLRGLRWPMMALRGAGIDGLLGADLLAPYEVSFDFPAHLLTLYRAYGCTDVLPPWPAVALPWRTRLGLPIVAATLDGRKVTALIDTGAHWSLVDRAGMGLSDAGLAQDRQVRSFGAGGMAFSAWVHVFGSLDLGDVAIAAPALRVTDLPAAMSAGLVIGDDLLAGHRLWLDYAGRRAFVDRLRVDGP